MRPENYFLGNVDLLFHFEQGIPGAELWELTDNGEDGLERPASARDAIDLYREAPTLTGQYAAHDIAGRARAVDDAGSVHRGGPVRLSEPLLQNLSGLGQLGLTGDGNCPLPAQPPADLCSTERLQSSSDSAVKAGVRF